METLIPFIVASIVIVAIIGGIVVAGIRRGAGQERSLPSATTLLLESDGPLTSGDITAALSPFAGREPCASAVSELLSSMSSFEKLVANAEEAVSSRFAPGSITHARYSAAISEARSQFTSNAATAAKAIVLYDFAPYESAKAEADKPIVNEKTDPSLPLQLVGAFLGGRGDRKPAFRDGKIVMNRGKGEYIESDSLLEALRGEHRVVRENSYAKRELKKFSVPAEVGELMEENKKIQAALSNLAHEVSKLSADGAKRDSRSIIDDLERLSEDVSKYQNL